MIYLIFPDNDEFKIMIVNPNWLIWKFVIELASS